MGETDIQKALQHAKDLLGQNVKTYDGHWASRVEDALDALVAACELPDGWTNDYSKRDPETGIEFLVYNPNGMNWFWSAYDDDIEDSTISVLPGFDTKEAAMKAVEDWFYNEWMPKFRETGERGF